MRYHIQPKMAKIKKTDTPCTDKDKNLESVSNYTYHGDHLVMYMIIKSLYCISETNRIQYINYIPI